MACRHPLNASYIVSFVTTFLLYHNGLQHIIRHRRRNGDIKTKAATLRWVEDPCSGTLSPPVRLRYCCVYTQVTSSNRSNCLLIDGPSLFSNSGERTSSFSFSSSSLLPLYIIAWGHLLTSHSSVARVDWSRWESGLNISSEFVPSTLSSSDRL